MQFPDTNYQAIGNCEFCVYADNKVLAADGITTQTSGTVVGDNSLMQLRDLSLTRGGSGRDSLRRHTREAPRDGTQPEANQVKAHMLRGYPRKRIV